MLTVIKGTTKKGQSMINNAKINQGFFITDVYDKPSSAKNNAWRWCYEKCRAESGKQFRIISHNTFSFSVAWEVENGLRIETSSNSYLILFPEFCR